MTLLTDTDRRLIDGLRGGVCTGPGPCDTGVIGEGKNWVTEVAGLPLYIRAIAHALLRSGHGESEAIQLAVGTVKRWAAGGGKVSAATRARAAKAVSEWEAKKAAAHGSRDDSGVRFDITKELRGPDGKWVKSDLNELKTDLNTGEKRPLGDILMDVHKGQQARKAEMALERAKRKAARRPVAKPEPKVVSEWNKGDPLPGDAVKTNQQEHRVNGELIGHVGEWNRHNGQPHSGKWWAEYQGSHHPIVFESKADAVDALNHWHAARNGTQIEETPRWIARNQAKAAAHGSRDAAGAVTEGGSAGSLLPVGPSPKVAKAVEATMAGSDGRHPDADVPHAFRGRDLAHCAICGQPAAAAIHQARAGRRSDGDDLPKA